MYFGNRESASQGSMQLGNKSLGFKATDAVVGWLDGYHYYYYYH